MHSPLFVTQNANKFAEAQSILGFTLTRVALDLFEPQEIDVEKVASLKATDAFNKLGKPALVEDTSLAFEVWNGLPGALIKWFMRSVDNEGILRMLQNETNRSATLRLFLRFMMGSK